MYILFITLYPNKGDGRTRDHTTVMVTTRADGMYCVPKDGIEGAAPPFVIHSNKRGQKDYDSSTRSLIDVENSRVDMCKSSQSHGLYTSEESTGCIYLYHPLIMDTDLMQDLLTMDQWNNIYF